MLALNTFSMNDFPYASLLDRASDGSSKKSFGHQQQSFQMNNSNNVGGMEWKPEHFPHKMYDLLEDVERKGLDDIVSWLPDGKSFKIHSQIGFEQSIMPLYFSGMSSYKSFRRQLNLYGIYQHRHRPNQDANGKWKPKYLLPPNVEHVSLPLLTLSTIRIVFTLTAYSHELLIRGQRHLCDKIARKKTNPPGKKSASSKSKSFESNKNNAKKRERDSLVATIDQRNLRHPAETMVGKQEDMLLPISSMSNNTMSMQASLNDMIRRSMLRKSMYDEATTQPNPVDIGNINPVNNFNRTLDQSNVFNSFMGQYLDDLPNNVSSSQVVDEIIATFQQR